MRSLTILVVFAWLFPAQAMVPTPASLATQPSLNLLWSPSEVIAAPLGDELGIGLLVLLRADIDIEDSEPIDLTWRTRSELRRVMAIGPRGPPFFTVTGTETKKENHVAHSAHS